MNYNRDLSIFLSLLLRHKPEKAHLNMDIHGWVDVKELIEGINTHSKYQIHLSLLEEIVGEDEKGRYRFNEDHSRIKACQGHTLDWVIPELSYPPVPDILYHGTTVNALSKIKRSGFISRSKRHAVHTSADFEMASRSAKRWKNQQPIVLSIDAKQMVNDGYKIGKSDNDVWCIEKVDVKYILEENVI